MFSDGFGVEDSLSTPRPFCNATFSWSSAAVADIRAKKVVQPAVVRIDAELLGVDS